MAGRERESSGDEYFDAVDWEERLNNKNLVIQDLKKEKKELEKRIVKMEVENKEKIKKQEWKYSKVLQAKDEEIKSLNRTFKAKEDTINKLQRSERYLRDGFESMKRKVNWLEEKEANERRKKEKLDAEKEAEEQIKRTVHMYIEEIERQKVIEELRSKKLNKPLFHFT